MHLQISKTKFLLCVLAVVFLCAMLAACTTLYKPEEHGYTALVVYDANGGRFSNADTTGVRTFKYQPSVTIMEPGGAQSSQFIAPTRDNYHVVAWYPAELDENGEPRKDENEEYILQSEPWDFAADRLSAADGSKLYLVALWKENYSLIVDVGEEARAAGVENVVYSTYTEEGPVTQPGLSPEWDLHTFYYYYILGEGGEKIRIRVSRSNGTVERSLDQLQLVMLLAVPAFLALAVFGSYFLAKLALRPIDCIIETAVSLGAGNLSQRITGIESRDEVGRLAGAFNGMLARLEDSFQREKQFTSDASHELRTPVSVIMAYAENLAAHAPDRETVEQASAILTESRGMHSIIAQLLALTRGYERKYQLSLEEITLAEMVSDVLAELTEEAAAGGITLIEQVPPRIQLSADQSLMTQLLLNLVENGIKYGKTGGTVAVSALEQDGHVLLTIQDDGIGIGEKDLPHIFDRFYRADQARDRSGSGLGLSIVKWIVELHGWTIQAASELGRGARFTIQI